MAQSLTQQQKDQIEGLIDACGLAYVIDAIGEIAYKKADHLSGNWQDTRSARPWSQAGAKLDRVAFILRRMGL